MIKNLSSIKSLKKEQQNLLTFKQKTLKEIQQTAQIPDDNYFFENNNKMR